MVPDGVVQQAVLVRSNEPVQEMELDAPFGKPGAVLDLVGVCRVERNPEEDEPRVVIVLLLLGTVQPAQRAMRAKCQRFRKQVAKLALLALQGLVAKPLVHLQKACHAAAASSHFASRVCWLEGFERYQRRRGAHS